VAVVRNITNDARSLGHTGAPPVDAGGEATVSDENFAGRAWPKETWALVKKPGKGYKDASVEDAHLYLSAEAEAAKSDEEVTE
jgi:hypothetical protein